jgi:hypothetical protein
VNRSTFSAIIPGMPSRTDDPPRSRPQAAAPGSRSDFARAPDHELETTDDYLLTEEFRAILSTHQRAGRWEPADEILAQAILGEVKLDFTRADLPPSGVVEIEAWAILGEVSIIVPDGADVELDGTPILGSIEQQVRKKGAGEQVREWVTGEREEDLPAPRAPEEPPYFRINGHAILGSIKVTGR